MAHDPRWKFPQGKSPEALYDSLYQLIRELRTGSYKSAADVAYDNTDSGLTADDVQEAIDEVEGRVDTSRQQGKTMLWVPALDNLMLTRTGAPAFGTADFGTINYRTLDFDPTSIESAVFAVPLPKSWDAGTVTFVPVWSHAAAVTNFGVEWFLRGQAIADGDSGDFAPAGQQGSVDTGGTANSIYQGPESAPITIQGTPAKGDVVVFELFRNATGGSDTLAVDARLHGIKLFYTTDAGNDI